MIRPRFVFVNWFSFLDLYCKATVLYSLQDDNMDDNQSASKYDNRTLRE